MIKKKIRIGIWGAWYGSGNIGDEAILHSIRHLFREKLTDVEFFVISAQSEKINADIKSPEIKAINFKKDPFRTVWYLAHADVFLIGGGTPVYDDAIHMFFFFFLAGISKLFRTVVATFAISVRSITSPVVKLLTRTTFRFFVDIVTLREEKSLEILKRLITHQKSISIFTDPAIILNSENIQSDPGILKEERINTSGKPLVVVAPHFIKSKSTLSKHHYDYISENDAERYTSALAEFADKIANDATVVFIPFHAAEPEDDRFIIEEIVGKMQNADLAFCISKQYTFHDALQLFERADVVVGTRFHALILAAAAGVPFLAINYETKGKGFVRLFGFEDFSFDITDCSGYRLYQKYKEALARKDELRKIVIRQRDLLRQQAGRNVDVVLRAL